MTPKPLISSGSRSQPDQYCSACDHRVYDLETHYQTEDHKRGLRHLQSSTWQDEWPKEEGLWWFYGWCFGKMEDPKPELCLVMVRGTAVKGSFIYITNGYTLTTVEGATGKWQRTILPDLPNQKKGVKIQKLSRNF